MVISLGVSTHHRQRRGETTACLYLLDPAAFCRDGWRVEINRFTGCEKLLERPLIHPYVAFQTCLEPPNGQAPCCLIHRYSNVGCHLHSPLSSVVITPGLPPAPAKSYLHGHQLRLRAGTGAVKSSTALLWNIYTG